MNIDFFISHSKETKSTFVIPLVQTLITLGFNVWIDRNGIATGEHIYDKIKEAIADSTYCIAVIDQEFLNRSWPLEEIHLFHLREEPKDQTIIIPIYIDITKETVYKKIAWLEGRAFEKTDLKSFNANDCIEIVCRIVSRYYKDHISDSQINTLEYSSLRNYSFPCKETLLALLDSKEYLTSDFRIAIIEICNIISVISAIYNAITTTPDKSINISGNFSNLLRNSCFNPNHIPTYNMYISALYSLHVILEKLKTLLDS